jgi:hypothetical protein
MKSLSAEQAQKSPESERLTVEKLETARRVPLLQKSRIFTTKQSAETIPLTGNT